MRVPFFSKKTTETTARPELKELSFEDLRLVSGGAESSRGGGGGGWA